MSTATPHMAIHSDTIVRVLSIITCVLILISIGGQWWKFTFGGSQAKMLIQFFNLDHERNIPTFFSVFLLFLAALLLAFIARFNHAQIQLHTSKWIILACSFLYSWLLTKHSRFTKDSFRHSELSWVKTILTFFTLPGSVPESSWFWYLPCIFWNFWSTCQKDSKNPFFDCCHTLYRWCTRPWTHWRLSRRKIWRRKSDLQSHHHCRGRPGIIGACLLHPSLVEILRVTLQIRVVCVWIDRHRLLRCPPNSRSVFRFSSSMHHTV